jgi:hypothetical protein
MVAARLMATASFCGCFEFVSTWKRRCWGAKLWTMLPITSCGVAVLLPGRFHVETARLKIFSQALRAFPRGNAISNNYS